MFILENPEKPKEKNIKLPIFVPPRDNNGYYFAVCSFLIFFFLCTCDVYIYR